MMMVMILLVMSVMKPMMELMLAHMHTKHTVHINIAIITYLLARHGSFVLGPSISLRIIWGKHILSL